MTSIDDGFPGLGASNSRRKKKKNNNNKKKKTQISSLGKELFLMGLNYDGGITVTINNKSTTIMKNTPPHSLNKEYRRMFPKATPFICACEKGHLDDVQNLIWIEKIKLKELPANVRNFKFKTFLNTEGTSSRNVSFTPLGAAARYEHLKIVQLLIGNGADLSICSKRDGWNVLHFAAYYSKKNSNLVRYLLQKLDINMIIQKDIYGETPLYYACKNQSSIKKGVIYTIEHNEKFKRYYEALRIKEERRRRREEEERRRREEEEIRRHEEEKRRRKEEKRRHEEEEIRRREEEKRRREEEEIRRHEEEKRRTREEEKRRHEEEKRRHEEEKRRTHEETRSKREEEERRIIRKYKKEFPKGTPLVCACEKGRFEDVKLLTTALKEMVNQAGSDSQGYSKTPLMVAAQNEHFHTVQHLIEQGEADPEITNKHDWNALHFAARKNKRSTNLIQVLLDHMSIDSINKQSQWGRSPLDRAYRNTGPIKQEIIDFIRSKGGLRLERNFM